VGNAVPFPRLRPTTTLPRCRTGPLYVMVSHRLLNQLSLATSRINQQYFSVSKSVVPNFGNNFTRAVNYTVFKAVPHKFNSSSILWTRDWYTRCWTRQWI